MKRFRVLLASIVVPVVTAAPLNADPVLFQALERERFGNLSYLSIDARHGPGWDVASVNDFAATIGDYRLSVPGSWMVPEKGPAYCNPYHLLLTRSWKQAVVSGGLGYGYHESTASYSDGRITCNGPDIAPFYCIDTVWKGDYGVEWRRQHSFFATMNGLLYLSPRKALVAGIEAAYKPQQGFRYEEEYINHPPEVMVRYYDYNTGAWGTGVSIALGLWREPLRFHRRWSALFDARWDYDYQKSLPLYNEAITSYGYSGPGYPAPTIAYVGEDYPEHRVTFEYTLGDANPELLFLTYAKKSLFSLPMPVIDGLRLSVQYVYGHDACTYVDRWTKNGIVEYGTTHHDYISSYSEAIGNFDVRCYFLKCMYTRATGGAYYLSGSDYWNLDLQGTAGVGIKVPLGKGLVADLGCMVLKLNDYYYYPAILWKVFSVGLKVSLVDIKAPSLSE